MASPVNPALWRIAVGIALTILVAPIWFIFMLFAADFFFALNISPVWQIVEARSPEAVLLLLASIVAGLPMLAIVLRWLHNTTLRALFSNDPLRIRWFLAAVLVVAVLQAILFFIPQAPEIHPNLSLARWLTWLAPALVLILLQSTTEELVFRGYAQQMLLARFGHVWVALLIPSIIFGLGHYDPETYGQNALLAVAVIAVWGLMLAHLTWQSGSLLPAIGLHFANNVLAILVVSEQGNLSALALYHWPFDFSTESAKRGLLLMTIAQNAVLYAFYQLARALYRCRLRTMLHSSPPPSI